MAINKNRLIKWFGGLALAALAPLAMANLVLVEGFNTDPTSFTLAGNAVVAGNDTHDGAGNLRFDSTPDGGPIGSASRSVSLVSTGTYLLDFFLRGNIGALTITFDGVSVMDINKFRPTLPLVAELDGNGNATGWLVYSGVISGSTGGALLFSFNDASLNPVDAFIDDVSIVCDAGAPIGCAPVNPNPMPEPGSLLLVGVALTGLALARRRKQI